MTEVNTRYLVIYKQLSKLADIPLSEWEYFQDQLFDINVPKDHHIFEAGQVAEHGYFVLTGVARFYYVDVDGNEVNKSFLSQGEFLASLLSLVRGDKSLFFAQSLTDMQLVGFEREKYNSLFSRHSCWQELGRKIAENLALKKEMREASLLLETPEQRYKRFLTEFGDLALAIPQYQVARYLGITAVSLSRLKNRINLR